MANEPVAEGPRRLAEGIEVRPAREDEIDDLMPLMRAYCEFYESSPPDSGVIEMLQHFQASDGVEAAGREGQREHRCTDALGLIDFAERGGAQVEADGAYGGGQHAAAQHFSLAASGIEDGLGT